MEFVIRKEVVLLHFFIQLKVLYSFYANARLRDSIRVIFSLKLKEWRNLECEGMNGIHLRISPENALGRIFNPVEYGNLAIYLYVLFV